MTSSSSSASMPPDSQRTLNAAKLDELSNYMDRAARHMTASLQAGKSDREAFLEAMLAIMVAKRIQKQGEAHCQDPTGAGLERNTDTNPSRQAFRMPSDSQPRSIDDLYYDLQQFMRTEAGTMTASDQSGKSELEVRIESVLAVMVADRLQKQGKALPQDPASA